MNSIFKLSSHGEKQKQRFLVITTDNFPSHSLFRLSPRIMIWDEKTMICDLEPCHRYWEFQFQKKGFSFFDGIEEILKNLIEGDYTACFCQHPWQGLLFSEYDLYLKTIIFSSPFAQNHFKDFSWEIWFELFSKMNKKIKDSSQKEKVHRKIKQMKKSLNRLGSFGPLEFKDIEASAIQRRYGPGIASAWRWTFQKANIEELPLFRDYKGLDGFPWEDHKEVDVLEVKRLLETPLSQWDHFIDFLREDLKKLSLQTSEFQKLSSLTWNLTLYNFRSYQLDISFRNPYSLQSDEEDFSTTLSQLYYAYEDFIQQLMKRDEDLDLPDYIPIVSWRFEISQLMTVHPKDLLLFSDDSHDSELLDLENKLPQSLERYQLEPHFSVPNSFQKMNKESLCSDEFIQAWKPSASYRPLFTHIQSKEVSSPPKNRIFTERIGCSWWESKNSQDIYNEYYKAWNEKGLGWFYKDQSGRWFEHGLYY